MNKDYTHIVVVQDKSSSMGSVRHETIAGFNAFLADQKQAPGKCTFTLLQFNTQYFMLHEMENIQHVEPLTESTYVPDGCTALLDAIGRTIVMTGQKLQAMLEEQRPARVVFAILTDGQENSSSEYGGQEGRAKVFGMIKHQTDAYKWVFVFIGANQDAIQAGGSVGVAASNSISTANNAVGVKRAYESVTSNLRSYRASDPSDVQKMAFTADQRQSQYDAGATHDSMADIQDDPDGGK